MEPFDTESVMEFYIKEIHDYKARRSLQDAINNAAVHLKQDGPYKTINALNAHLSKLGRDTRMVRDIDLIANVDERLESLRERIEQRQNGRTILGVPTGITKLDEMYGGAQRGDFWVIAAWTGNLKSWLALYIAMNAWKQGYRVLYFSLEMSAEQIGYRFDTLLAGGEFSNLSLTHADGITFDHYKNWADTAFKDRQPFTVVTNENLDDVNQNTVLAKIEQWHPDIVILDYHGLFDTIEGGNEVERTKQLSKAFKRIAVKTGTPLIDITAVTQDKKDIGNRPAKLHELSWSKQLAYDSDLCLSLCKHESDGEEVYLEVEAVKVRRSPEFKFYLNWKIDKGIVNEIGRMNSFDDE